jgi:CrcB protein
VESAIKILLVAAGGALGAVARYLVNLSPLAGATGSFPFPTFVINIVGSFLIGFVVIAFADRAHVNENVSIAIVVGFIGAFTTFSTFEMELYSLARERHLITALAYLMLSVFGGFAALLAGVALGRRI